MDPFSLVIIQTLIVNESKMNDKSTCLMDLINVLRANFKLDDELYI